MNTEQVSWAKSHDWYTGAIRNSDGAYTVLCYCSEVQYSIRFTDYRKLRSWAGY